MFVDASAMVAILTLEPETDALADVLVNLGDCFAYAVARQHHASLLFKGDDFAKTDIRPAITPG
jgi:uncharacterized protein with PIN domain